jgi:hypothetical protein
VLLITDRHVGLAEVLLAANQVQAATEMLEQTKRVLLRAKPQAKDGAGKSGGDSESTDEKASAQALLRETKALLAA